LGKCDLLAASPEQSISTGLTAEPEDGPVDSEFKARGSGDLLILLGEMRILLDRGGSCGFSASAEVSCWWNSGFGVALKLAQAGSMSGMCMEDWGKAVGKVVRGEAAKAAGARRGSEEEADEEKGDREDKGADQRLGVVGAPRLAVALPAPTAMQGSSAPSSSSESLETCKSRARSMRINFTTSFTSSMLCFGNVIQMLSLCVGG
jgi:hypothetical protein